MRFTFSRNGHLIRPNDNPLKVGFKKIGINLHKTNLTSVARQWRGTFRVFRGVLGMALTCVRFYFKTNSTFWTIVHCLF